MKDANGFLAITNVNINFNNVSGILSNANQQDLYDMSVANGSKQNLYEFMGYATTGSGKVASTIGSIVVIGFCVRIIITSVWINFLFCPFISKVYTNHV